MNLTTRWLVLERDSFTCQYCGRSSPHVVLQVDHIEARAWGGDDRIGNLITSCWSCNQGKKHRDGTDGLIRKNHAEYEWADGRAQTMLQILIGAYAEAIGCTTGDVFEWLFEEVS